MVYNEVKNDADMERARQEAAERDRQDRTNRGLPPIRHRMIVKRSVT